MKVEVIQHAVTPQALEAKVEALRKEGCGKAEENKRSIADMELANILMQQEIDKLKKEVKNE